VVSMVKKLSVLEWNGWSHDWRRISAPLRWHAYLLEQQRKRSGHSRRKYVVSRKDRMGQRFDGRCSSQRHGRSWGRSIEGL